MFVEAGLREGCRLALAAEPAHHAARVLRLREGEAVVLFDGRGGEYEARLSMPGRGQVLAEIGAHLVIERESPLAITLLQAVSSGEKMDFTIQKAVELGVAAIQPLLTERSVVRLSVEREAKKLARWRRVAIAACEQCGRNRVPEVRDPVALERYQPEAGASKILLSPLGEEKLSRLAHGPVARWMEEAGFADVRLTEQLRGISVIARGSRV